MTCARPNALDNRDTRILPDHSGMTRNNDDTPNQASWSPVQPPTP